MEFVGILILLALAAIIAGGLLILSTVLGPKRPNPTKNRPFECGVPQLSPPEGHFSIKFYVIAMLFVLFDIELVFFFPWGVVFRQLGWLAFWSMASFTFIIVLGYIYALKKGALEWEK